VATAAAGGGQTAGEGRWAAGRQGGKGEAGIALPSVSHASMCLNGTYINLAVCL